MHCLHALLLSARPTSWRARPVNTPPCSFVMSSVALAGVLTQWQAIRVAVARRKYGVNYPTVRLRACGEGDPARG